MAGKQGFAAIGRLPSSNDMIIKSMAFFKFDRGFGW